MPKPWELDWSAGAPAPDAMPLPLLPFFGRARPPMLGDAGAIDPNAVAAAAAYGMASSTPRMLPTAPSPMPSDQPGIPSAPPSPVDAGDPSMMQAGYADVTADPWLTPAAVSAFGVGGQSFAEPEIYDDRNAPAPHASLSFDAGPSGTAPAPGFSTGQAPVMLAQDVLRTNGFPDAPPRPVTPGSAQGAPRLGFQGYAPPPRQPELRVNGMPVMPMPEPPSRARQRANSGAAALHQESANSAHFGAANLKLSANEPYRNDIVAATRQGPLPPQGLAAMMDGEARLLPGGAWDPNSANRRSGARGIAQIIPGDWLGQARRQGSYLNGIARNLGWLDRRGNIVPAHRAEFLNLRFDPRHSIYAMADDARHNLAVLARAGLILDNSPAALTLYAYIAHHEGLAGAAALLRGTRHVTDRVWEGNVPTAEQQYWLSRNGNNRDLAYREAFLHYASQHVDVRNRMNDARDVAALAPETLYRRQPRRSQAASGIAAVAAGGLAASRGAAASRKR